MLTDIVGICPITVIIGHTGDVDRFRTKARDASDNATEPVEASSATEPDIG